MTIRSETWVVLVCIPIGGARNHVGGHGPVDKPGPGISLRFKHSDFTAAPVSSPAAEPKVLCSSTFGNITCKGGNPYIEKSDAYKQQYHLFLGSSDPLSDELCSIWKMPSRALCVVGRPSVRVSRSKFWSLGLVRANGLLEGDGDVSVATGPAVSTDLLSTGAGILDVSVALASSTAISAF